MDESEGYENLLKMMQMMKAMNEMNKQNASAVSEENNAAAKENAPVFFDDRFNTREIKILKSAIPFFEYRYQKNLAVMIKMIEMQRVMEYYKEKAVYISGIENPSDWRKELMKAVRPHLESEKQNMLDLMLKFMEMQEAMSLMQNLQH